MRASGFDTRVTDVNVQDSAGTMAGESPVDREAPSSSRWPRYLMPIALMVIVTLSAVAIHHLARTVTYAEVGSALRATPIQSVVAAIVLTFASFFALSFYDVAALDYTGNKVPFRIVALTSFCAYAVGNTAGFGPLSGGAVRYRFYTAVNVSPDDVARIIAFVSIAFGAGLSATTAVGFLAAAETVAGASGLSAPALRLIGASILGALAILCAVSLINGGAVSLGRLRIQLPRARIIGQQLLVTALDICASAGVLWFLLPDGVIGFPAFLAIYAVAVGAGVLSHVPAGLGVFEAVIIAGLGRGTGTDALLGALVLYRLIYHAMPLALAAVLVAVLEVRRALLGERASQTLKVGARLGPLVLSGFCFVTGGMLVISGVTPIPPDRIDFLDKFVPLTILESAHFLSSIIGIALVIAARGLAFRLDGAWWFAILAVSAALVLAPFKAIAFGETAVLALVLIVLAVSRRVFDRPASLLHQPMTPAWLVAIGTLVVASAALLLFAYKDVQYASELWWQFEADAEAPRSLRALVGVALAAIAVASWSLIRPPAGRVALPSAEEIARAVAIVDVQGAPDGNLVRMGDKSLLFSQNGQAFIMYARRGRSWIALSDPLGPRDLWPALIWRFVELARQHGGRAVFYQASADGLALYADAGLIAFKLGEDAKVPLATFSVTGAKRAALRHAMSRGEREGLVFSIVPPAEVDLLFDELQNVSNEWLAHHRAREKRFSLGAFERGFVLSQPIAILRKEGRIVAFATIMKTSTHQEATIDLMRFTRDAPNGSMDFLFLKLIEHFRTEGYERFNLGMAPLSGLSDSPAAPLWNRIGRAAFDHGERLYNFRGLRSFKSKFQPQWQSRYMVVSGGFDPIFALADATILISGGVRGVIGK